MKFVLILIFGLIIAIEAPVLVILLISRKHKVKNYVKAIVIPVSSLALIVSFVLIYFAINYKASGEAKSYLNGDAVVSVTYEKSWYRFDNQSSDENAIVFYTGAKVDPVSYSPLCSQIAHQGIDVYLVKSPLYFPLLSVNAASEVVGLKRHTNLYMMGHSLGGTSAALFLSGNKDETFKGIVFLASYPNRELNDSYRCLSIYGSNDTVLNKAEYEKNRSNFPAKMAEIVIDGGNHSNFGDYGFQRGDGAASISRDEQTRQTKNAVVDFIVNPS